jgi:hypothetical protein
MKNLVMTKGQVQAKLHAKDSAQNRSLRFPKMYAISLLLQ